MARKNKSGKKNKSKNSSPATPAASVSRNSPEPAVKPAAVASVDPVQHVAPASAVPEDGRVSPIVSEKQAKTEEAPAAEETQPEETKPEETKPEETKPEETKTEETKPEETKPEETKPEETQAEEVRLEETLAVEEAQPEEAPVEEAQPEETQVEEAQLEETQAEENQAEDDGKYKIDLSADVVSGNGIEDPTLSQTDDFAHLVIAGEAGEDVASQTAQPALIRAAELTSGEPTTRASAPPAVYSMVDPAEETKKEAEPVQETDELLVADSVGELAEGVPSAGQSDEIATQEESGSAAAAVDNEEDRDAEVITSDADNDEGADVEEEAPVASESQIEESAILISDGESDNESDATAHGRSLGPSVNMEDSQAELLSSNLLDSMYRSSILRSVQDEVHALESEGSDNLPAVSEAEETGNAGSEQETPAAAEEARKYVLTPSAFADEPEPDVIMHLRPASVSQQSGSPATPEPTPVATEEEAANEADNEAEGEVIAETSSEGELVDQHELESVDGTVHVARSEADSFVHVDDGEEADGVATVPESVVEEISDIEPAPIEEKQADMAEPSADIPDKAAAETSEAIAKVDIDETANKIAEEVHDAIAEPGTNGVAENAIEGTQETTPDVSSNSTADRATREISEAVDAAAGSDNADNKKEKKEKKEKKKRTVSKGHSACPVNISTFAGAIAVVLAAVSRHYFRLPGPQNRQVAIAGGVASAIAGLGALASAFFQRK